MISDCNILVNHNHGIQISNFIKNDLLIKECAIDDNFCDGINISSTIKPTDSYSFKQSHNFNNDQITITPLGLNEIHERNIVKNKIIQSSEFTN